MAILLKGDGAAPLRVILKDGLHVVGSGVSGDGRIAHPTVSRRHAEIEVDGEQIELRDLQSSNGSFVDGQRVSQARLQIGQQLKLGSLRLQLCRAPSDDAEIALRLDGPVVETAGSTLPAGVGDRFTLHELPRLLAQLAAGTSEAELLRAFGAALCSLRGVEGVRVSRGDERYFERVDDEAQLWAFDLADLQVELQVASGIAAQQFQPLLALLPPLRALAGPAPAAPSHPDETAPGPSPLSLDPVVIDIYARAVQAARSTLSVLIRGESGTGKEVLARHIHLNSGRAGPLVALNCAAIPPGLLEAELMGIEKGVATGVDARPGSFRRAHGGTLFLDEIGDMPADLQAKILRVLQEREVHPVGARAPIPVDVRIIAATHRDLSARMDEGQFRADLHHRIADWDVRLPPLRERPADIGNLALHFLARELAQLQRHSRGITTEALRCLQAYSWPGNIRELEREMARCAVFLGEGEALSSDLLKDAIRQREDDPDTLEGRLAREERRILRAALAQHQHNATQVAAALGISRSTLYRRMQELQISPREA